MFKNDYNLIREVIKLNIYDAIAILLYNLNKNPTALDLYKTSTIKEKRYQTYRKEIFNLNDYSKIIEDITGFKIKDLCDAEKKLSFSKSKLLDMIVLLSVMDELYADEFKYKLIMKSSNSDKVLNSILTNDILLYPSYVSSFDHRHSQNNSISSILNSICYMSVNNCKNIQLKHLYFEENYDYKKNDTFKIACIPFSNSTIDERKNIIDDSFNSKIVYTYQNNRNEYHDKRYLKNVEKVIKLGYNIVLSPEACGKPSFSEQILKILDDKSNNSIVITPSYHDGTAPNIDNVSQLISKEIPGEIAQLYKSRGYIEKYPSNGKCSGQEYIRNRNEYTVLHIKGFGRILVLICSDFFNQEINDLITTLNIDCILNLACTTSYNRFDEKMGALIGDNRFFIQCNNCAILKEMDENKKISPINLIFKEKNKNSTNFDSSNLLKCFRECEKQQMCYFSVLIRRSIDDDGKTEICCESKHLLRGVKRMENKEMELMMSELFYTILEESTDDTQKKMDLLKVYYDSAVLNLEKAELKKDIISLCRIIDTYESLKTIQSNMVLNYETNHCVFEIKNFSNMLYIIYQHPGIRHIDLAEKLKLKSSSALSQLVNKTINYGLYIKEYNNEHKIANYNLSALGKKFINDHKAEMKSKLKTKLITEKSGLSNEDKYRSFSIAYSNQMDYKVFLKSGGKQGWII